MMPDVTPDICPKCGKRVTGYGNEVSVELDIYEDSRYTSTFRVYHKDCAVEVLKVLDAAYDPPVLKQDEN